MRPGRALLRIAGVLKPGAAAPDFPIGRGSLHRLLEERAAIVFFFPKAFTPG